MPTKITTPELDRLDLPSGTEGHVFGDTDVETIDRVLAEIEREYVASPSGFDPDHPFFTHEPAEPTGESKTATETDEYLYQ